eukprot:g15281.t1
MPSARRRLLPVALAALALLGSARWMLSFLAPFPASGGRCERAQSTADTDFGALASPKRHQIKMSPSTRTLLVNLEAQKCIGCCMQRSKVLENALTYCRIPGYCENCPCTDDGWTPLLIATQRRDAESVETLLSNGAEVDCKEPQSGWTPLMFAASLGDVPIVKLLLKYKASVNTFACPHDWNPLCAAIQANNKDVVRLLLDAGADISLIKKRHPALAEVYESTHSFPSSLETMTWRMRCVSILQVTLLLAEEQLDVEQLMEVDEDCGEGECALHALQVRGKRLASESAQSRHSLSRIAMANKVFEFMQSKDKHLWASLEQLDVQRADASVASDKENILRIVADGVGFDCLNQVVRQQLLRWLATSATWEAQQQMETGDLFGQKAIATSSQIASFLHRLAQYEKARELLACAGRVAAEESEEKANLLRVLGQNLEYLGRRKEAADAYRQASEMLEELGCLRSHDGAAVLTSLALQLSDAGELDEAMERYQKAWSIREATGAQTLDASDLLAMMGVTECKLGLIQEGLRHAQEARRLREHLQQLTTPQGAQVLQQLSFCYLASGDSARALEELEPWNHTTHQPGGEREGEPTRRANETYQCQCLFRDVRSVGSCAAKKVLESCLIWGAPCSMPDRMKMLITFSLWLRRFA